MIIDLKTCDQLLELAQELHLEYYEYEGCLLDSYIIHVDKKIRLGGRTAKYIVLIETYVNEWSSCLEARFINNEKILRNIEKKLLTVS